MSAAIIIPCYNEEKRINKQNIEKLLVATTATLFLANDGSIDNTLAVLEDITTLNPERIKILHFSKNEGKAMVIYKSVNKIITDDNYDYIGYFDADFSTPAIELKKMIAYIESHNINSIFGSRVQLLNSKIERKIYRHYIGRIIITLLNIKFKLAIYDTQCGAKIFSKKAIKQIFTTPFYTSWLFDVEIFLRLREKKLLLNAKEFPLSKWTDVAGSNLRWIDGFKIMKEIITIYKKY